MPGGMGGTGLAYQESDVRSRRRTLIEGGENLPGLRKSVNTLPLGQSAKEIELVEARGARKKKLSRGGKENRLKEGGSQFRIQEAKSHSQRGGPQ